MKRFISIVLSILIVLTTTSLTAFAESAPSVSGFEKDSALKLLNTGALEIDDDGSDGYTGDYVVIYNPLVETYSELSTGNMSGLIETEVGIQNVFEEYPLYNADNDFPHVIDIDSILAAEAEEAGILPSELSEERDGAQTLSFEVGDTHTFELYSSYNPLPSSNVEFEVLAKGDHCYVWTPTSTQSNVYPLDEIDESFAQIAAEEFDSKFALMQSSFGDHTNGNLGDGRLNLLFYNIDCGWTPNSSGYIAGFFTSSDIYYNGMPCLNIDTYPGVHYVANNGEVTRDISRTFNVTVHEYQHLINYSNCGYAPTWLNESMSAAAEEICYPGSSISARIQAWMNYKFNVNEDWHNPPAEHEYNPNWNLHNGYSMYDWSNYLEMSDRLALYAQVSLFAQYVYTQYGNHVFRELIEALGSGYSVTFPEAFEQVTGQDVSEFVRNFRIAVTANDPTSYEGLYGFIMQEGYDPEEYYDVENLYNWLSPVVFTGDECTIGDGGAIAIKPIDGVYYPPADADGRLEYYGVTLDAIPPEPVALTGISIAPDFSEVYAGASIRINTIREPENANNFDLTWTSSNPDIATVEGNNRYATVNGITSGTVTITVNAHDNLNNLDYTATAVVEVKPTPTVNEALNIENGTLEFNIQDAYEWEVDVESDENRASAHSTNQGVGSSQSTISITVDMNAGETMSFDWRVSSETNYDELTFLVNNVQNACISGEQHWSTVSYTATQTRSYTFTWRYSKDSTVNRGSDCGWIDNVYVPGYVNDTEYELGDVNRDGIISIPDALAILRYAIGSGTLDEEQLVLADVDANGVISIADSLLVLRIVIGSIS